MAVSKTKILAVLATGGALVGAAILMRLSGPGPIEPDVTDDADDFSRRIIHENFTPPEPRTDLTAQEQARLEEIQQEAREARRRVAVLNRELVHARGEVMRTNADARAAVQRRQTAQQARAAAVAADAELSGMRGRMSSLHESRAQLRSQFSALDAHARHSRPGEDGVPPAPVEGCYFCEEWDPAGVEPLKDDPHTHPDGRLYACCGPIPTEPLAIERYRLLQRERRLLDEMREAGEAHAAALRNLDARPEVAAAIVEARDAESALQEIVQADAKVAELVHERDGMREKSVELSREQAGILYARPGAEDVVSNRTGTR
jgi:hypothetical protein